MAAPAKNVLCADSSSSDDEALRRCHEAVWETRSERTGDGDSKVQPSKRVVVADHEHDGNKLQVTQGFRTHVAKKLGHLLDSSITEWQNKTFSCLESTKCDDEGFRLFSTSVPGQLVGDPPAPVRRRPVPSSSDSDSEMETMLREAAVSVKDLLPTWSLPSTLPTPSAELKQKKMTEEEESHVVNKKKKRKQNQEEVEQVDSGAGSPLNARRNGEHTQVKMKRKKKKRRNTEEVTLN